MEKTLLSELTVGSEFNFQGSTNPSSRRVLLAKYNENSYCPYVSSEQNDKDDKDKDIATFSNDFVVHMVSGKRYEESFLDYLIVNTWNGDGYVITKQLDSECSNLWECHLGSYCSTDEAREAAVVHFMISRPEHFSSHIFRRVMHGIPTYQEWFKFHNVVTFEGIKIPQMVGVVDLSGNASIGINGKPVGILSSK